MIWLGERRGDLVDCLTQRWVRLTGRRVALADAPWLLGPSGSVRGIGADFFERWADSQGLRVLPPAPDDGLSGGVTALDGPRRHCVALVPERVMSRAPQEFEKSP